jgi:hypothetical protein
MHRLSQVKHFQVSYLGWTDLGFGPSSSSKCSGILAATRRSIAKTGLVRRVARRKRRISRPAPSDGA